MSYQFRSNLGVCIDNIGDESRCVVILGSQGFIGSHFLNYLTSRNHKVLDFAKDRPLFSPDGTLAIVLNESTDIYWFASKVNPIIAESSHELVDQELHLFQHSLNSLQQQDKNHLIIFPSSGGTTYGESKQPCVESDPIQPVNKYGQYKFEMEHLLKESELRSVILRISNVYGPNQPVGRGQGVIAKWLHSIKKFGSLTLFGEDTTIRDFLYIDDLISALSSCTSGDIPNRTYNIGSGVGTTLRRVIEILREITEIDIKVETVPKRAIDRLAIELDISLAMNELNWVPRFSLSDGIQEVWNSISIS